MTAVDERRLAIATDFGLRNVKAIAAAATATGLPFHAACALMQKESDGCNVYGNDKGGALAGFPLEVSEENFAVFHWLVFVKGQTSNGVGPCQITWKGFFPEMDRLGLKVWNPFDNMRFGFGLLLGYQRATKSWTKAGTKYNGGAAYGLDLGRKVTAWKKRLA